MHSTLPYADPELTFPAFLLPCSDVSGHDRAVLKFADCPESIVGYFLESPLREFFIREYRLKPDSPEKPWFALWSLNGETLQLDFVKGILHSHITEFWEIFPGNYTDEVPKEFSGKVHFKIQQQVPASYQELFRENDTLEITIEKGVMTIVESVVFQEELPKLLHPLFVKEDHDGLQPIKTQSWDGVAGGGEVQCKECGHREPVYGFVHGYDRKTNRRACKSTYQCETCLRFDNIAAEYPNSNLRPCRCGGKLGRNKLMSCPQCKSKDVMYVMHFIT